MKPPECPSPLHLMGAHAILDPLGVDGNRDLPPDTDPCDVDLEATFLTWEGMWCCSCGATYAEGPDGLVLVHALPGSPLAEDVKTFESLRLPDRSPISS